MYTRHEVKTWIATDHFGIFVVNLDLPWMVITNANCYKRMKISYYYYSLNVHLSVPLKLRHFCLISTKHAEIIWIVFLKSFNLYSTNLLSHSIFENQIVHNTKYIDIFKSFNIEGRLDLHGSLGFMFNCKWQNV